MICPPKTPRPSEGCVGFRDGKAVNSVSCQRTVSGRHTFQSSFERYKSLSMTSRSCHGQREMSRGVPRSGERERKESARWRSRCLARFVLRRPWQFGVYSAAEQSEKEERLPSNVKNRRTGNLEKIRRQRAGGHSRRSAVLDSLNRCVELSKSVKPMTRFSCAVGEFPSVGLVSSK